MKTENKILNPLATDWQRRRVALDVTHEQLQRLGNVAEEFCTNFIANRTHQSLLVISGPAGTGKTHVAKAVYRFCNAAQSVCINKGSWAKYPTTMFHRWPALADDFRNKNHSSLPDLFNSDLLFLDDVGAESDPWADAMEKLCQVLTRREKKFTVITTNIQPLSFSEKFEPRIADRLIRFSRLINLKDVPSYAEVLRNRRNAAIKSQQ